MRACLQEWSNLLPHIDGGGSLALLVGAAGGIWEIGWEHEGTAAADERDLRRVGEVIIDLVRRRGFRVLLEPSCVLGGRRVAPPGLERLPAAGGAELTWRRRGVEVPIDAAGSLDVARDFTERSVLELDRGLEEVLRLSEQQCADVAHMAESFDATGGLGDALTALEGELSSMGQCLHVALSGHLAEVGGAASSAKDIVKLASTVTQIAHAARVLTFNARLESARLGPEGKGFVVIAGAIRELAGNVSASNDLVASVATEMVAKLPMLQRATAQLAATTDAQLAGVRERLASLREAFKATRGRAMAELKRAESAANAVRSRSHEVIQHLQFQDRTSQLLMRVKGQVQAMEAVLGLGEVTDKDTILRVGALGRRLDEPTIGLAPGAVALF